MGTSKNNKTILTSVQNGISILKLFSKEQPIWGLTEIANSLHLPKSTVSRLVSDLVVEGYLEKEKSKYQLGLSLLGLSGVITSNMEIHREAIDSLKMLVQKLGESAHIAILEESNVVYILKEECKHPVRLLSHVGKNNPASCTSSGKVLLAYEPAERIKQVLESGLIKLGPNSITDPEILLKQLTLVKQNGFALCIDEMHEDVVSIAAPIKDYTGEVVAAVSVVGPKQRIDKEKISLFIVEVVKTGNEISSKLGY
ncbi:IclR family transcriptional regulator [Bacillus sp. 1P10SD]|uniref:IclR family transcriptional regulator n=1 Tax=Bacillus sp. 1P10SD TaxID=3132265 RepID=UPI0039A71027